MTAVSTAEDLFTFGLGTYGQLAHGVQQAEHVPRLVDALAGNKVVGAMAGGVHTAPQCELTRGSCSLWAWRIWGVGPRRRTRE